MNELDLLTRLRDEVPLTPPSPGAQRAFRDGLTGADGTEPAHAVTTPPTPAA
jgi:hypothetical protein